MDFLGVFSTTRASFAFYNTEEDVERFLNTLSQIRRKMGYAE
jgi:cysteine desulfurase/selenocysteine lyase